MLVTQVWHEIFKRRSRRPHAGIFNVMRFGACYYPEQWPRERWQLDADLMVECGIEMVRIGEFAWSSYEPTRGHFEWEWLDTVLETLDRAGLTIVLGTPTATPPVWLALERPEILSVGPDGRRRSYGSRRHTCPTAAAYREESARVVAELVNHCGRHPALVAWQIDNEPGNHDSARCWCDECQDAFTAWLGERFGSIDSLNEAWGTAFWSQTYPTLESVRLPTPTMTSHHPALLLAHRRFANDQVIAGLRAQADIVRSPSPKIDIVSNVYSGDIDLDAGQLSSLGGIYAIDSYPHGVSGSTETSFFLDRRPLGRDTRLWVMEQQVGPINWTIDNPPVPDGQVRTWIRQAAEHGVEAMFFFRWRAARFGQEHHHSGVLGHDGRPTRAFGEIKNAISEVRVTSFARSARAALLCGADDAWMVEIEPHLAGLTHRQLLLPAYKAAVDEGWVVDIVDPEVDLTPYDLVLAPGLLMSTSERVDRIHHALAAGAMVIVGPRSLVFDREAAFIGGPTPQGIAEELGAIIEESLALRKELAIAEKGFVTGPWVDVLRADGCEILLTIGEGSHLAGQPVAVQKGRLGYCGVSSPQAWTEVLRQMFASPKGKETQEDT